MLGLENSGIYVTCYEGGYNISARFLHLKNHHGETTRPEPAPKIHRQRKMKTDRSLQALT